MDKPDITNVLLDNSLDLTQAKVIEYINRALPYANQVKDWDLSRNDDTLYFNWRAQRFKVDWHSERIYAHTIETIFEVGSDIGIIFQALLRRVHWDDVIHNKVVGEL